MILDYDNLINMGHIQQNQQGYIDMNKIQKYIIIFSGNNHID
ncbi:hypothetical protein pb186bvf_015735 [Paramecium bursaria]